MAGAPGLDVSSASHLVKSSAGNGALLVQHKSDPQDHADISGREDVVERKRNRPGKDIAEKEEIGFGQGRRV